MTRAHPRHGRESRGWMADALRYRNRTPLTLDSRGDDTIDVLVDLSCSSRLTLRRQTSDDEDRRGICESRT